MEYTCGSLCDSTSLWSPSYLCICGEGKIVFFGQILVVDSKVLWVFQILMIGGQMFPTIVFLLVEKKFFNVVYNLLCQRLFGGFESRFFFR